MRWVRYRPRVNEAATPASLGVLVGDNVHSVGSLSLRDLIATRSLDETARGALDSPVGVVPLSQVRLLSPLAVPPSIRDFMAFEQHVEGMGRLVGASPRVPDVWYDQPLFYFTNPAAVVGPYDDVAMPPGCNLFDFELEVAAVVGPVKGIDELADLTVEEAAESVVGYTLMNDWSARDLQRLEMAGPLGPCKGKDSAITLGPWLLTADELPDLASGGPTGVRLEVAVNGVFFGSAALDSMSWSFAEMVAYASRGTRLQAGDVIGSGTCGDGCLAERWGRAGQDAAPSLKPDDVVSLAAGVLGQTENRVAAPSPVRQALERRTPIKPRHQ